LDESVELLEHWRLRLELSVTDLWWRYFALGGILPRSVKALGSQGTFRRTRHVLAFASIPLVVSLVIVGTLPGRLKLVAIALACIAALLLAETLSGVRPVLARVPTPAEGWLTRSYASFPEQRIGQRFAVRGTHVAERLAPGRITLTLDAGLAFGSGEHGSTQGCLRALQLRLPCGDGFHPRSDQYVGKLCFGHGQVSRFTDGETMDLFLMAYCGKVNQRIVETLQRHGANAIGLSGMDGAIARGRRKPRIRVVENGRPRMLDGDYAGAIESIDTRLIHLLLDAGYLPVLSPPALSYQGEAINVDGDKLAMELAVALGAAKLLIFSNTPGLLRDLGDPDSTVPEITLDDLDASLELAQGRMKKKVLAAADAVRRGVGEAVLADANRKDAIGAALSGGGTHIGRDPTVHAAAVHARTWTEG